MLSIAPALVGSTSDDDNTTDNNWGRSGMVIPLFLHFAVKPSISALSFGSCGPSIMCLPSRTTRVHQLDTTAPRWNLTSNIFQLPLFTLAFPILYERRGGGSSRPGIMLISGSMDTPKPSTGGTTGFRPRVGNPLLTMVSALTLGGLHAYRIICAVSLLLSLPIGCPATISHNSAGTQMAFFAFPRLTTGRSAAYLSFLLYSNNRKLGVIIILSGSVETHSLRSIVQRLPFRLALRKGRSCPELTLYQLDG